MIFIALLASEKVYCSTENNYLYISHFVLGMRKHIHQLSVGESIDKHLINSNELSQLKSKLKINNDDMVIGMFGSFHESKNIPKTLSVLLKMNRPFKLLYIGSNKELILDLVPKDQRELLEKNLIATGFVSDQDCSHYFQLLDVLISYFVDGLSTRRSSAIMALSHSIPIISTITSKTESIFKEQAFLRLLSVDNFSNELEKTLDSTDFKQLKIENKSSINDYFENNFSWSKIIRRYYKLSRLF